MHEYMRAVGFSAYNKKKDINNLLNELIEEFEEDFATEYTDENGEVHEEIRCEVAHNMGLIICGVRSEEGEFDVEYYYPFLYGREESNCLSMSIHRHVDECMYSGLEDDPRLGITLIFRLTNAFGYMNATKEVKNEKAITNLAALCIKGTIILPVSKTEEQELAEKENIKNRDSLVDAARSGDIGAIETLTMADMNTFAQLNKRLGQEDIYSIVDTCFMPHGVECDVYSVIGDIIEVEETMNYLTGEELYDLTLNSNDMIFHVGINKNDLTGEPEVGRRFKGKIWMMGHAEVPSDDFGE